MTQSKIYKDNYRCDHIITTFNNKTDSDSSTGFYTNNSKIDIYNRTSSIPANIFYETDFASKSINQWPFYIEHKIFGDFRNQVRFHLRAYDENHNQINNGFQLNIMANNTCTVTVTHPAAWRTALDAVCKSGDTMSGNLSITKNTENLFVAKRTDVDINNITSEVWIGGINSIDKNNNTLGYFETKVYSSGAVASHILARNKINNTNFDTYFIVQSLKNSTRKISTNSGITFESNVNSAILFSASDKEKPMVRFKIGDANGHGIYIGGGGLTVIGGGESAEYVYNDSTPTATTEQLYLTADSNINIWTNCQDGSAYATKNTINTDGTYSGAAAKLQDPGSSSYKLGLKWSGDANVNTASHLAVWSTEVPNGYTRVIQALDWSAAHQKLSSARPMFKYIIKTYNNITLNKGQGGYATFNDYGGIPTVPSGYTLFSAGIYNWGTMSNSDKGAINVSENGLYIMGPNGVTIDRIEVKFIYVLSDNLINLQ